jgi:hypothetical protein
MFAALMVLAAQSLILFTVFEALARDRHTASKTSA